MVTFALSLTASTSSTAWVVKLDRPRYYPGNFGLRDPGEVSHAAVGRFISDLTPEFRTLQFCPVLSVDHRSRLSALSNMKFGR
jgi:hypothetical protein